MYYNWPIRTATNTSHIRKLSISLSLIEREGRTEVQWPETVRTERNGVQRLLCHIMIFGLHFSDLTLPVSARSSSIIFPLSPASSASSFFTSFWTSSVSASVLDLELSCAEEESVSPIKTTDYKWSWRKRKKDSSTTLLNHRMCASWFPEF